MGYKPCENAGSGLFNTLYGKTGFTFPGDRGGVSGRASIPLKGCSGEWAFSSTLAIPGVLPIPVIRFDPSPKDNPTGAEEEPARCLPNDQVRFLCSSFSLLLARVRRAGREVGSSAGSVVCDERRIILVIVDLNDGECGVRVGLSGRP